MEASFAKAAWVEVPVGQRSRKQIAPFALHRPESIEDLCAVWRTTGPDVAFLAGGVDLVNEMKQGYRPTEVIDLKGLKELAEIRIGATHLSLGAMVTHQALSRHAAARRDPLLDALSAQWGRIANLRIRHQGTLGGNIMARRDTYDLLPCLAALDAQLWVIDHLGHPQAYRAADGYPPADGLLTWLDISRDWTRIAIERSYKPSISVALASALRADGVHRLGMAIGCLPEGPVSFSMSPSNPIATTLLPERAGELARELFAACPREVAGRLGTWKCQVVQVSLEHMIKDLGRAA